MSDHCAKFGTEHLSVAASRIESAGQGADVGKILRFPYAVWGGGWFFRCRTTGVFTGYKRIAARFS